MGLHVDCMHGCDAFPAISLSHSISTALVCFTPTVHGRTRGGLPLSGRTFRICALTSSSDVSPLLFTSSQARRAAI